MSTFIRAIFASGLWFSRGSRIY